MADIFISYVREDIDAADKLAGALESQGWSVFWDRRIPAGKRFDDFLNEQLEAARCVIVLWSSRSILSDWVRDEAAVGRDREILVPAHLDDVLPPFGFRSIQSANLIGWQGDTSLWGFQTLSQAVRAAIKVAEVTQEEWQRREQDEARRAAEAEAAPSERLRTPVPPVAKLISDLDAFRDINALWCPEMVALPVGEFLMGAPEDEEGRSNDEGPQHRVRIGYRLGLGRYPVTVAEYRKFVEASGHRPEGGIYVFTGSDWKQDETKSWRAPGFAQTDHHPVVGVSWRDAVAYSEWLGKQTAKSYRLPSEAEWEYASRAGTTTRYAFGDAITPKDANYSESKLGKTTEVGAYPPNAWGLYDMHGNVWEWVQDVWHNSYEGAPTNGTAWIDGEGDDSSRIRVLRGGSWGGSPRYLRSANRSRSVPDIRGSDLGFRVARTLD